MDFTKCAAPARRTNPQTLPLLENSRPLLVMLDSCSGSAGLPLDLGTHVVQVLHLYAETQQLAGLKCSRLRPSRQICTERYGVGIVALTSFELPLLPSESTARIT
jgi:hypothetical protein